MSGKVAKPKEDKDASKGKRRALAGLHSLLYPQITGLNATMRSFIPCMVLKSPFEVWLKTIPTTGWFTIPSTMHVDIALWDMLLQAYTLHDVLSLRSHAFLALTWWSSETQMI